LGRRGPPPKKLALLFRLKYLEEVSDKERLAKKLNINQNTILNYEQLLKQKLSEKPLELEENLVETESDFLPSFEREQLKRIARIPGVTEEEIEDAERFLIEFSIKKAREEKARALLNKSCLRQLEYVLETEKNWTDSLEERKICNLIEEVFTHLGISYIREFTGGRKKGRRVDFYLPEFGIAIEVKTKLPDSDLSKVLAQCSAYSQIFGKVILLLPSAWLGKLGESLEKFRDSWFVPFKAIALEDFLLYCVGRGPQ